MTKEAPITISNQMAEQSQIPRDPRGRIVWAAFKDKRDILMGTLEQLGTQFFLGSSQFEGLTRKSFRHAVDRFYPDGMKGLRKKLELPQRRRHPNGFWGNQEQIEQQAKNFLNEETELSIRILRKKGRSDLAEAIVARYSGGIKQLFSKLGLEKSGGRRNYWTNEKVEEEAATFFQEQNGLSTKLLRQRNRKDLLSVIIKKYPGGMTQLRLKLGLELQRKDGYWTPERVEKQASEIYQIYGKLTQGGSARKYSDFWHAVLRNYPGGLNALREKLGIIESRETFLPAESRQELQKLLEAL